MGNDRVAERQRGMQMAGPFAHLVDTVARDMHYNESLHLHDVTERFEECGYCYLRAGRALGHVARALVPRTLVPVEVFGGDCGTVTDGVLCEAPFAYGLSDAVSAWSDCNRAVGRIYRVEDIEGHREPGDSIAVWSSPEDSAWFERRFGDPPNECTRRLLPKDTPEIVVLCGSTRFKAEFYAEGKRLSFEGSIVLSVSDLDPAPENRTVNVPIDPALKARLDWLHLRKIDLAGRVHIVNPGGYIGESTRDEIAYATAHGKPVTYMEV